MKQTPHKTHDSQEPDQPIRIGGTILGTRRHICAFFKSHDDHYGVLLPFILIFMTLLINKKAIMNEWTNSRFYNIVAWVSVAVMIGLTLALIAISIQELKR